MAKTILLADDSVTIQKVVELTFMDEDYQVIATGDGTSALEKLPEVEPNLVIADVHMPGADGYEVCRQTKEGHPEIPVLLLVGTFEQFDEQKAASVGADGHLKKPFDSQDLLSQVDALIVRAVGAGTAEPAAEEPTEVPVEELPPAAGTFGIAAASPLVGDLEPPSLEASAPLADDVWSAAPVAADAAPAPEAEAPVFATEPEPSSFPDIAPSPPVGQLDQAVTDTAAVDLNEIGMDSLANESPAFNLEESVDEVPIAPVLTPSATAFETAAPVEELEVPSLEAPPIEDFAPFIDEPVVEESVEETVVEEPIAEQPAPWASIEPEAAEDGAMEEIATSEPELEEEVAAPETVAPEAAGPEAAAPEAAAPEPVAPEAAAPESATVVPAAATSNGSGPLSDEDVERIAQRVAELVGKKALQDVAWEVLPDLAEVIIKERIRELESEVV